VVKKSQTLVNVVCEWHLTFITATVYHMTKPSWNRVNVQANLPAHFLSLQIAVLSSLLQMFTVLGMYYFDVVGTICVQTVLAFFILGKRDAFELRLSHVPMYLFLFFLRANLPNS
jgi:hypothetical protein